MAAQTLVNLKALLAASGAFQTFVGVGTITAAKGKIHLYDLDDPASVADNYAIVCPSGENDRVNKVDGDALLQDGSIGAMLIKKITPGQSTADAMSQFDDECGAIEADLETLKGTNAGGDDRLYFEQMERVEFERTHEDDEGDEGSYATAIYVFDYADSPVS